MKFTHFDFSKWSKTHRNSSRNDWKTIKNPIGEKILKKSEGNYLTKSDFFDQKMKTLLFDEVSPESGRFLISFLVFSKNQFFGFFSSKKPYKTNSLRKSLTRKNKFSTFFQNFFDEKFFFDEMIWLIHKDVFWHFKPFSNHFIGLKRYFFGFFDENLTIPLRKSLTRKIFSTFFSKFFRWKFFFRGNDMIESQWYFLTFQTIFKLFY